MKSCIVMVLLMSLAPLANATEEHTQSDSTVCAWGDGSFEQGCGSWATEEQAQIKKFVAMAVAHKKTQSLSLQNDSLKSQQASNRNF